MKSNRTRNIALVGILSGLCALSTLTGCPEKDNPNPDGGQIGTHCGNEASTRPAYHHLNNIIDRQDQISFIGGTPDKIDPRFVCSI